MELVESHFCLWFSLKSLLYRGVLVKKYPKNIILNVNLIDLLSGLHFTGADRIYLALEDMLGKRPCAFWYYSWKYTAPAICTVYLL